MAVGSGAGGVDVAVTVYVPAVAGAATVTDTVPLPSATPVPTTPTPEIAKVTVLPGQKPEAVNVIDEPGVGVLLDDSTVGVAGGYAATGLTVATAANTPMRTATNRFMTTSVPQPSRRSPRPGGLCRSTQLVRGGRCLIHTRESTKVRALGPGPSSGMPST